VEIESNLTFKEKLYHSGSAVELTDVMNRTTLTVRLLICGCELPLRKDSRKIFACIETVFIRDSLLISI